MTTRVRLVECRECHAVYTGAVRRRSCAACDYTPDEYRFYTEVGMIEL